MRLAFLCSILSVFVSSGSMLFAQDNWPQFRGTDALGVASGNPPTVWELEKDINVAWKTPIDGLAHSSPVIWGDDVFLTTAISVDIDNPSLATGWVDGSGDAAPDKGDWHWKVVCLDRKTGKVKWTKLSRKGKPSIERHMKATHANCTIATNGKHVVAFFGSEGLYCYDLEGNLKWERDLGKLHSGPYNMKELEWGFASSPVIYKDFLIVQCDCLNTGFISIMNLETGEEIRRIKREDVATWSTPCIFEWKGKTQIVCNGYKQMASYDFATGEQLWTLREGGDVPVPTPLFHDGLVYITNGHGKSPVFAISPDATGDITPKQDEELPPGLVWFKQKRGSYMPTPIVVGEYVYVCNDNGVLTVFEAKTGEQIYRQRVATGGGNNFSASAVATNDHVYFSAENGNVIVVKTGAEFERVAVNEVDAVVMATPAIAGDQIFIRTVDHLICIAHQEASNIQAGQENSKDRKGLELRHIRQTCPILFQEL